LRRAPRRRGRPLPAWVNALCLTATAFSTLLAGTMMTRDEPLSLALLSRIARHPAIWIDGLPYAAAVLFILGAHEMGHYVACRLYRIDASLPFFLPGPNLFGTFGAVIRIRAPFTDRRALFDVGVAGPIAGFVAALPVLFYGLRHSTLVAGPPQAGEIGLTPCLLLDWLYPFYFGTDPEVSVRLHPAFAAAWLGLFATSLNLLPVGQLDGGHMLYALSPRAHRLVSRAGIVCMCALGLLFEGYHLILFGVLFAIIGVRHPAPVDEARPLGTGRILVALLGLLIFVLCFIPVTPRVF
jgi:membrane-associated protease RseP (regulator of RpoE activity)